MIKLENIKKGDKFNLGIFKQLEFQYGDDKYIVLIDCNLNKAFVEKKIFEEFAEKI